ncbi:MAG TPA: MaoC family dehydratase [Bryobacteraceae bacterium]|nr:MaoC family dehydratase [Bryobacteraceae bacterium]
MTIDQLRSRAGQEIGVSSWREITQQRIDDFARVTGDDQWIHIDCERARRESPYGATIAHGFLTVSLLPVLIREAVALRARMSINYGFNRLRFTGAVPAGSRVRARFMLNSLKDVESGVEIAWGVVVEVEGREKPALVAEWLGRAYA